MLCKLGPACAQKWMSASQLEKASKTLLCVDPGFFYRDSITQMCVYSLKIETLAALPKGGVILTSQLQCLNEARRLGKAGVHSGDCKEPQHFLLSQMSDQHLSLKVIFSPVLPYFSTMNHLHI